ncbi:MAG: hypothetical protein QOC92_4712, partial [Acidimicrobiaceae bacterium]
HAAPLPLSRRPGLPPPELDRRSVSRSARDRQAVVADVVAEPFTDPADVVVLRAWVHS